MYRHHLLIAMSIPKAPSFTPHTTTFRAEGKVQVGTWQGTRMTRISLVHLPPSFCSYSVTQATFQVLHSHMELEVSITDRADRDRFQPHRKFCWTEPKSEFMLEGPTFPKHVSSRSLNGIKALFTEKKWRWLLGWEPTTKEEQEGNPQSCGWGQNPKCEHGVQEK